MSGHFSRHRRTGSTSVLVRRVNRKPIQRPATTSTGPDPNFDVDASTGRGCFSSPHFSPPTTRDLGSSY